MVPHATAKKVKERRSETREHVGQFYNIELSIGGVKVDQQTSGYPAPVKDRGHTPYDLLSCRFILPPGVSGV
jgi:hypothetical protein